MSLGAVQFRVYFYTEEGELFAWYTANSKEEAFGLRRKMKNGYAEVKRHVV